MSRGFSFIEILIVISLIAILSAMSAPFVSSFVLRNNFYTTSDRVLSEIWKAQSNAMVGRAISGNEVWGVCVTGGIFRMFNGSCASPNYREDFTIPNGVTVSGLTSITFGNLRGDPSSATTITVSSSLDSNTITINAAGQVQRN